MSPPIPPSTLWHERSEQLERDLERVRVMLGRHVEPQHRALAGKLRLMLAELDARIAALKEPAGQRWAALAATHADADNVFATLLELLGGVVLRDGFRAGQTGLDDGLTLLAECWLNQLRQSVGLDGELTTIVGRGPLLDRELGAVYVPFLSLDLWSLPLLARAVGLLAAGAEDSHLAAAIEGLAPALAQNVAGWERRHLEHLCADMLATLMLGPVYAITVFALDLDYRNLEQYGQNGAALPTPAQRAAAILSTLTSMDATREPGAQGGLYRQIASRIEQLWGAAPETLVVAREAGETWHRALYDAIRADCGWRFRRDTTDRTWQRARSWYEELRKSGQSAPRPPQKMPEQLSEFLTMIWLCRIDDPARAATLPRFFKDLMQGKAHVLHLSAGSSPAPSLVPHLRGEQLAQRWDRLEQLLKDEDIPRERLAAVSGRFYRMLSLKRYTLDEKGAALQQPAAPATWGELAALEDDAQPLLHEAQEFLGGLYVQACHLDREPGTDDGGQDGPSICDLADRLLAGYARRTGINWSAGTVPGRGSFVESSTDIIRVDFLDLSVWNLPVMAHEFGHLAAPKTPEFAALRHAVTVAATAEREAELARAQLEEFFADCFATYCMGPAFACCAVLNLFDPANAFTPYAAHPTHQERVDLILHTLELMGAKSCCGDFPNGRYHRIGCLLRESWKAAVAEAGAQAADTAASTQRREHVAKLGAELFTLIDKYYRLGAGYTVERWAWAQELACSSTLLRLSLDQLRQSAAAANLDELLLDDVLNVLWWARVNQTGVGRTPGQLSRFAQTLLRPCSRGGL